MRSFGFLYDLQIGDQRRRDAWRVMPHLRFLNAEDGEHLQKWQFKRQARPTIKPLGTENKTVTHYHLAPHDWEDLPGRRAEALLQRDPDQGELALSALRFRPRLDAGHAASRCNDRGLRPFDLRLDPHPGDAQSLVHAQPRASSSRPTPTSAPSSISIPSAFREISDAAAKATPPSSPATRPGPAWPRPSPTRPAGRARRSSSCARSSRRKGAAADGPRRDLARRHALGRRGLANSRCPQRRTPSPSPASRISAICCASPPRCRRAPKSRCSSACISRPEPRRRARSASRASSATACVSRSMPPPTTAIRPNCAPTRRNSRRSARAGSRTIR